MICVPLTSSDSSLSAYVNFAFEILACFVTRTSKSQNGRGCLAAVPKLSEFVCVFFSDCQSEHKIHSYSAVSSRVFDHLIVDRSLEATLLVIYKPYRDKKKQQSSRQSRKKV